MSGVPAEQDNETTDYRTTRQGKEQRANLCLSASYGDFPIKEDRLPRLWRSDWRNLIADQLPPGRRFCPNDAGLELATGGFAAVLPFQRDPIDCDRYIAAVNPDFHVWVRHDGIEAGSARFQVGQALRLGHNRAAGVDEGVIVRPNPFERGGILLRQGGAVLLNHLSHFLLSGFVVRGTRGLR
jgi:hypothetical protein